MAVLVVSVPGPKTHLASSREFSEGDPFPFEYASDATLRRPRRYNRRHRVAARVGEAGNCPRQDGALDVGGRVSLCRRLRSCSGAGIELTNGTRRTRFHMPASSSRGWSGSRSQRRSCQSEKVEKRANETSYPCKMAACVSTSPPVTALMPELFVETSSLF